MKGLVARSSHLINLEVIIPELVTAYITYWSLESLLVLFA